jgi:hypothetical protein
VLLPDHDASLRWLAPVRRPQRAFAAFFACLGDLRFGPWKLTDDGESDWEFRPGAASRCSPATRTRSRATSDLLDGGYGFAPPIFRERHWAYWRFEQSLSAEDAFTRVREVHARLMALREQ